MRLLNKRNNFHKIYSGGIDIEARKRKKTLSFASVTVRMQQVLVTKRVFLEDTYLLELEANIIDITQKGEDFSLTVTFYFFLP